MAVPMRARDTFWWGRRLTVEGSIVNSDDPVVKTNPAKFEAIALPPIVEQATAAPGERRTVIRPKKET